MRGGTCGRVEEGGVEGGSSNEELLDWDDVIAVVFGSSSSLLGTYLYS